MALVMIPLGTMGWIPSERRETTCIALVDEERLFLFDCGTGARRLGHHELEPTFGKVKECFIFLSHYHLDHTIGIIYLPKLLAGRRVTIAGPGKEMCGHSTAAALERLTSPPLFSHPIRDFPMELEIRDLEEGVNRFPGFTITAARQQHTDPSAGMRLEDIFCYATDTVCSEQTVQLARGVPMLAHECWLDDTDYEAAIKEPNARVLREHSHVSGVAGIAERAGVHTLALCHFNPGYREGRLRRMEQAAKAIFPNTVLLHDLQQFTSEEEKKD